ncbi:putative phospholipid-transporting ATPase 5 [Asimina triloba]
MERDRLFKKWGIGLDTKQRRVQLAVLLWTKTEDIEHIKASADVVASLVGFQADGQALKEMFGLSFSPQWSSQRKLEESEYSAWQSEFLRAKTSIGAEREALLERAADMMEKDLILVGATAVEDKLQKGVPQCIDKLAQAGLKLWVLTGDKMETAINIGFACSLPRQDMKQILITSANADADKAMKENILKQITIGSQMIRLEKDPNAAFALIIDGKTLSYALQEDVKIQFLDLAVDCASVICCRVSPKQKALVTRLVKVGTGKTTLAIGDGANDVGMIQEADIGVGISGDEGMQAVMASDFSISQFHYLERLLVIHGHWCYKRIAQMICYFFYKNIAFGLTLFYFEAYTGCTGQSIYDDWYLLLFNVLLTSLPVISLGVFEQDVPSDVCLQFPALYQQGSRNLFFDWTRILGWMIYGVFTSLIIFFLNIGIFHVQAIRTGGQTSDMAIVGATMFTSTIWTVNCQIALSMSHFTWIQHLFIWSSICMWYLFSTTLCQISQRAVHYATNLDAPMLGQFFTQPLEGERSCNGSMIVIVFFEWNIRFPL